MNATLEKTKDRITNLLDKFKQSEDHTYNELALINCEVSDIIFSLQQLSHDITAYQAFLIHKNNIYGKPYVVPK